MLIELVNKERRAVSVIKAALVGLGFADRAVCVSASSWCDGYGHRIDWAIFVGSGGNVEPFYVQGETLLDTVKTMLATLKGHRTNDANSPNEPAPF